MIFYIFYSNKVKFKKSVKKANKSKFLANVSHELRTPLNSIIGFSEMMLNENHSKINTNQYKEYIQNINNSGKHLLSVINNILDYTQATSNELELEFLEVDLNKVISYSMRAIEEKAIAANIKLIEDIPKEHIIIKADSKRLKQILLNLLSNSLKFTAENGSITLKINKLKQHKLVEILVVDTGIGICKKDIPKALLPFGQIDNKLNRKYEGGGFGLPLTKKLVELMGGKFILQSKIGIGTTISLIFEYNDCVEI